MSNIRLLCHFSLNFPTPITIGHHLFHVNLLMTSPDISFSAYQKSLDLIQSATTPQGMLASISNVSNYRRIWSRDSVICGLAGLLAGEESLLEGFKASIISLGNQQAKQGQIPSNVQFSDQGEIEKISYGGLCGRVDAVTWWLIGLCTYSLHTEEKDLLQQFLPQVEKCFDLLAAWEFNGRGLLYVPQSGNWADEYILQAYVLYDQLLHLWALQLAARCYQRGEWAERAQQLRLQLTQNYWLKENAPTDLYHPAAYQRSLKNSGPSQFWEAGFSPGGYTRKFDLLANSLVLLLGLSSPQQNAQVLNYVQQNFTELLPSFWPPIFPNDPEWFLLESNYAYEFRNKPYEFHNAGIWPAFNGWWGLALCSIGENEQAKALLQKLSKALAKEDWGFYECLNSENGKPHGTPYCTWSAAGQVILYQALQGKRLIME